VHILFNFRHLSWSEVSDVFAACRWKEAQSVQKPWQSCYSVRCATAWIKSDHVMITAWM